MSSGGRSPPSDLLRLKPESLIRLKPLPDAENYQLRVIEYDSPEYQQAAQLRYRLFYQAHNIPFAAIFDPQEPQDLHLAITDKTTRCVLAYGRLGQTANSQLWQAAT